uniref:Uncharacterized protein n=1 Tax=Arundo donax TaxID=35708 RepID=A0A0A9BJJ5_ARUDO
MAYLQKLRLRTHIKYSVCLTCYNSSIHLY